MFLAVLGATGCQSPEPPKAETRELRKEPPKEPKKAPPKLIIDVRTPPEYEAGHINGAINIPYEVIDLKIMQLSVDKDREILLYCLNGSRSAIAAERLGDLGYTRVTDGGAIDELRTKIDNP